MNNKYRRSVKDVKVIPGEEIVSQRYLLLIDMVFKKKVRGDLVKNSEPRPSCFLYLLTWKRL